ncbi:MAG: hypothetical protein WCQ41_05895 [Bacillota bacterium]
MKKDEIVFKSISLLPIKNRRQILTVKILRVLVTVTSFLLIASAMFFVITPLLNLSKNQEISVVDNKIQKIREEIKGMQESEKIFNTNKQLKDVLVKAMGEGPDWFKLLNYLNSAPMTISLISADVPAIDAAAAPAASEPSAPPSDETVVNKPKELSLKYIVFSSIDFMNWISKIQSDGFLKNVKVGNFEGSQTEQMISVSFSIPNAGPYEIEKEASKK